MNLNDLANRIKSVFPSGNKHKSVITDSSMFGGNRATQWLDLYNENPRLAVVHKLSADNGSTPYSIQSSTRRSTFYVKNHPLDLEIQKHSVPQFFALWTAYRLMQGVVYIAFDLENGNPTNLKVFTKNHLLTGNIGGDEYEFKYGSETIRYPAAQVIVDTDLDLVNPYFNGKGKAEAIKDEIETDEFVQKYIKYFYINSARPDVFITAEKGEEMSETDVARLESEWYRKFQGVNNAHKPVFLNWAASITSVPTNHKDMELLDTRRFYRDTTIQHFGVPPEIMGIVENSNKATVIAAEHIYAKQVRLPILEHMELIINTKLLPLFRESVGMKFHFENIIPDDIELTLKIVGEGTLKKTITVNEWRAAMGFPRIADDYGDSIVGGPLPELPVKVESISMASREFKEFKELIAESFIERASVSLGKELENEIIIVKNEDEEEKDVTKKSRKSNPL